MAKDSTQSEWMKVMGEGQLTRDSILRTRREIEADREQAEALAAIRRARFPEAENRRPESDDSQAG